MPRAMIDWTAVGAEAVDLLRAYLQIDTTNPPGNEIAGARFLADVLQRAGIESRTVESAPGRANLVARVRGDGSLGAIVLPHHLGEDGAAAEPDRRRHPGPRLDAVARHRAAPPHPRARPAARRRASAARAAGGAGIFPGARARAAAGGEPRLRRPRGLAA